MNKFYAVDDWLIEQDIPAGGGQPDSMGMQAPAVDPYQNPYPNTDPNIANPTDDINAQPGEPDLSQDPETPDMPEDKPNNTDDFEVWKNNYFKEVIKGDTNNLLDMLNDMRDKEGLTPYQHKFVEDNHNIQVLRSNSNISKASDEIRRAIKSNLDLNNPATSVVTHITDTLAKDIMLSNIFVKLDGYGGLKGDLHRKFIAALTCSVQVGSGANNEDIIFNETDYSIMMSTRFNSKWGDVFLGNWSLREDDAERYLSEPEVKRLHEGSPEEKEVLIKRIVLESIAKQYDTRAFIVNVVKDDGTIAMLGWDLAGSIRSAYTEGKLVVKVRHSDNAEALIDAKGNIIPLVDLDISFLRDTGEQDEEGFPEKEELKFMERRNGSLFLAAGPQLINESASIMQGMIYKELPYTGNPSDLAVLKKCVYSAHDLLMRQC